MPGASGSRGSNGVSIPFAQLSTGVRKFPEGDDVLDLTRMVRFAMENPGENWMYPKDYAVLLKHIGGPATITPKHYDSAVHDRWKNAAPPPQTGLKSPNPSALSPGTPSTPTTTTTKRRHRATSPISHWVMRNQERRQRERGFHERAEELQVEMTGESRTDRRIRLQEHEHQAAGYHHEQTQEKKRQPFPDYRQVREANGQRWGHEGSTADANMHQAQGSKTKRDQQIGIAAAVGSYSSNEAATLTDDDSAEEVYEPYERGPPLFVPPRTQKHNQPTAEQLVDLFLKESNKKESDVFSPYAFSGPRTEPPYRPVHLINLPAETDVSGWAENIRWVKDQVDNFPAITQTGWDESPEHMQAIAEERVRQQWVSDTWLEQYVLRRKQEKEKENALSAWMPPRRPMEKIKLQPAKFDFEALSYWFTSHGQYSPFVERETFFEKPGESRDIVDTGGPDVEMGSEEQERN